MRNIAIVVAIVTWLGAAGTQPVAAQLNRAQPEAASGRYDKAGATARRFMVAAANPVSYTHLTLPTNA